MEGKDRPGYYSPREACYNVLDLLIPKLEEDKSLTVCVSHDHYVAIFVGMVAKWFRWKRWMEYTNGLLILRRSKEYYAVWRGREYPLYESIDSTAPVEILED
jgi:hypothetical protein